MKHKFFIYSSIAISIDSSSVALPVAKCTGLHLYSYIYRPSSIAIFMHKALKSQWRTFHDAAGKSIVTREIILYIYTILCRSNTSFLFYYHFFLFLDYIIYHSSSSFS
eukprot:g67044.t1